MKIWFPAIRAGSGSDIYVQRLAKALERRGVEAPITWLPHMAELMPWLARVRPPAGTTVIHANSWYADAFAQFGLPLVVSVHHCVHDPQYRDAETLAQRLYHRFLIRSREREAFKRAAAILTGSQATRNSVARVFGATNLQLIPYFIDTDVFRPAAGPRAPGPFRLLFVGNLSRRKGADYLARVIEQLGDDFELRIAAGLRGNSSGYRLPRNAVMLPRVPTEQEMARYYQESDAILMLSRQEGFGYVAVEAASCARPVVGFDSPAIREVIGSAGLLVAQGDISGLIGVCRRLSADAEFYTTVSGRARALVLDRFSEATAIEQYLQLYRRLCGDQGVVGPTNRNS